MTEKGKEYALTRIADALEGILSALNAVQVNDVAIRKLMLAQCLGMGGYPMDLKDVIDEQAELDQLITLNGEADKKEHEKKARHQRDIY